MSKRGKSKRSHRCAVFLSVVLCAGLFTGCGDKKAVEISTGSTAAEKDVRNPYDGQSIDEQPNITETDTPPAEPHQASPENAVQENVDYSEAFGGLNGCAVVFDPQDQVCRFYNKTLCETAVSPCSTFKIVSALMGLKYHVLENENSTMGYDGTQYGNAAWNQDLSLKDAFQSSCVWYFRKVIDQVGQERVKEELTALDYGNCNISEWAGSGINPGEELNGFWLASSLKISPYGQVRVLSDIFEGRTGFSPEHVKIVKNIMSADGGGIYGKTGTGTKGQAWFVGFSESEEKRTYFAVYLEDTDNREQVSSKKAKEIALKIIGQ